LLQRERKERDVCEKEQERVGEGDRKRGRERAKVLSRSEKKFSLQLCLFAINDLITVLYIMTLDKIIMQKVLTYFV
jgi:hypothetical protein